MMQSRRDVRLITITLLLSCGWTALRAQDWSSVAALLEAEKGKRKIPGYTAALYVQGKPVWNRASGMADLKTKRPVLRRTPFRIASISKPLTATALLHLEEAGRLTIGDDIRTHCPAFPVKPYPITLEQLLGHLGGIRHYRNVADANNTVQYASVRDSLRRFAADPLVHEPGTKYLYTTYGYSLLGCAIEGASGLDFAVYMRDKIFATAGMCDTRMDALKPLPGDAPALPRAEGYRLNPAGILVEADFSDNSAKYPGGGMLSTATDLIRFVDALLKHQILRAGTLERMWSSGSTKGGRRTNYGLGWGLARAANGDREIYHTGDQQGASTILYLRPERGFAFVWLTNLQGTPGRLELARQVYRLAVDAQSRN
jgi:CubicO group peptidase (beta-lactamase class C family)